MGGRVRKSVKPDKITKTEITDSAEPYFHGFNDWSLPPTEVCPVCLYAYADGGYCPDCGWSLPVERKPYGTS